MVTSMAFAVSASVRRRSPTSPASASDVGSSSPGERTWMHHVSYVPADEPVRKDKPRSDCSEPSMSEMYTQMPRPALDVPSVRSASTYCSSVRRAVRSGLVASVMSSSAKSVRRRTCVRPRIGARRRIGGNDFRGSAVRDAVPSSTTRGVRPIAETVTRF